MKFNKMINRVIITIMAITLSISILYTQEFKKTKMQWKGKLIEIADKKIVVKVKKGISIDAFTNRAHSFDFEIINGPDDKRLALMQIPNGKSIQNAIDIAESFAEIEGAEPIVAIHASVVSNDQYYGNQWGLPKINAPSAWDISTGSSSVILGILDSGIPMQNNSLSHPDLQNSNRILLGNDYTGEGQGVRDRNGHGTCHWHCFRRNQQQYWHFRSKLEYKSFRSENF